MPSGLARRKAGPAEAPPRHHAGTWGNRTPPPERRFPTGWSQTGPPPAAQKAELRTPPVSSRGQCQDGCDPKWRSEVVERDRNAPFSHMSGLGCLGCGHTAGLSHPSVRPRMLQGGPSILPVPAGEGRGEGERSRQTLGAEMDGKHSPSPCPSPSGRGESRRMSSVHRSPVRPVPIRGPLPRHRSAGVRHFGSHPSLTGAIRSGGDGTRWIWKAGKQEQSGQSLVFPAFLFSRSSLRPVSSPEQVPLSADRHFGSHPAKMRSWNIDAISCN